MAVKRVEYNNYFFDISYEIKNQNSDKYILFLHGWGSNRDIMKNAFYNFFLDYSHIYVDMPGFGKSKNSAVLNSSDYLNIMRIFLDSLEAIPSIIVGHSFGGKIATLLNPKLLVLLSSAGVVVKKPFAVKMKIAIFKIFKSLGFGFLYPIFSSKDVEGMKQNMYETFKNVVDEDFSSIFRDFSNRALIFWGKDDSSTPLSSGLLIGSFIQNSSFFPLDGGHYFFMQNAKIVEKEVNNG
jgi:pimeloyl-ACP methyl ester carboxylesterase